MADNWEELMPYLGDGTYQGVELAKPLQIGKLKFIVVGTGRCGTVYLAKLLTSVGLPCGHEVIFRNDGIDKILARVNNQEEIEMSLIAKLASVEDEARGVSWFKSPVPPPLVGDSSYMAAPYLDRPEFEDVKIIHVVREPMKVINSFVEGFQYFRDDAAEEHKPYLEFIYSNVPELRKPMDPVSRCALYYVKWNELIEAKAKKSNYHRHRIESGINKLMNFLGVRGASGVYQNKASNHKLALEDKYTAISQVPIRAIREQLMHINDRYYKLKI